MKKPSVRVLLPHRTHRVSLQQCSPPPPSPVQASRTDRGPVRLLGLVCCWPRHCPQLARPNRGGPSIRCHPPPPNPEMSSAWCDFEFPVNTQEAPFPIVSTVVNEQPYSF